MDPRLAPGLLEKLESLNPTNDQGERSVSHHPYQTDLSGASAPCPKTCSEGIPWIATETVSEAQHALIWIYRTRKIDLAVSKFSHVFLASVTVSGYSQWASVLASYAAPKGPQEIKFPQIQMFLFGVMLRIVTCPLLSLHRTVSASSLLFTVTDPGDVKIQEPFLFEAVHFVRLLQFGVST